MLPLLDATLCRLSGFLPLTDAELFPVVLLTLVPISKNFNLKSPIMCTLASIPFRSALDLTPLAKVLPFHQFLCEAALPKVCLNCLFVSLANIEAPLLKAPL